MTPQERSWLALSLVDRLGSKTLKRLLEAFETPESILEASAEELVRRCDLPLRLGQRIAGASRSSRLRAELGLISQHDVQLLPVSARDYPARLLGSEGVYEPPPLLYRKGLWPLPQGAWISIVGTREPTRYGEGATRRLIEQIAAADPDAVIVSGLARGIDTVAHEQALECGLHTVAVLGGGLTGIYPPENLELSDRIARRGALLTEFAMAAKPMARHFPVRNRVIAGLGDAVLVVEAAQRSGALITASFAINYRRPVLAVPGNVDQRNSIGTNRLIQTGQAQLVMSGADILAAARGVDRIPVARDGWIELETARKARPAVQEGEKGQILATLQQGPRHPDELAGETALPIERLIALLLELELSGEIYQTPENQYALA